MDHVKITSDKINLEDIISLLNDPSSGATSIFMGTTRNHHAGKGVTRLDYEAYEPMAIKHMASICADMRSKWPLIGVAIVHRIGSVPVGEASVVIIATSEHRTEAQKAVMFGIDAVKSTVPIWKKEQYSDGTCSWKSNSECKWT